MSYQEACKYFQMGTQLYSKKSNLYSSEYPYAHSKAKDITIETSDGRILKDFSTMGIGSCLLGYSNKIINNKVIEAIQEGSMSSLNNKYEILLARKLQSYEPNKMFRFTRTGGEAMAVAIRILRSYTGKDIVMTNGYNGWHDWFLSGAMQTEVKSHLGINNVNGIPKNLFGTCYYFNSKKSFEKIISQDVAGIVLEVSRYNDIDKELLEAVINSGKIIIIDEITTGWRARLGGYYKNLGLEPDLVVYGKSISNGFPFSVVCGKENIMRTETFISSTYWTESIGTAAALATIEELETIDYSKRDELEKLLRESLEKKFDITDGFRGMIHYKPRNREKWIDYMLDRGFLVTDQIYLSFAHTLEDVEEFIEVLNGYENKN